MKYRACLVLLSLCACEDATSPAGSGDPPIVDPQPTLAEKLEGTWYLSNTRCGGSDVVIFDADQILMTFSRESVDLVTATSQCLMTIPLTVHYDDAASAIRGDATGEVRCVPADCSSSCGSEVSSLLPNGLAASVAVAGETLTLASDDPEVFPTMACLQNDEEAPAELELVRDGIYPGTPFEWSDIDPTVCDGFDAYAADRTVYYVAQNEAGANNDACDGLAPTDEGAGHCPFRDFSSERVRKKLFMTEEGALGVRSITVAVRAGVYTVEPLYPFPPDPLPLWIDSVAESKAEAVVLTSYNGEPVVLDGTCAPDLVGCDSPEDPGRIWNMLALRGNWIRVEGITFDNVHKWNITVASSNTCVLDNTFIGSYGSDSDSMKSFGGSGPNVIVRKNEFHTGFEQAIDATNARGWVIEDNHVHDAPDRGFGFKFGASGNIVRNNVFENLGGEALSLGGGSSAHYYPYEAQNLLVEGNRGANLGRAFATVFACKGCTLRNNDVDGSMVGILLADDENPSGCPGGCPLSADVEITKNRLRHILGNPTGTGERSVPPNVFLAMYSVALDGFTAGDNLYCLEAGSGALFGHDGQLVDFDAWKAGVMTDTTSSVEPVTSPRCSSR